METGVWKGDVGWEDNVGVGGEVVEELKSDEAERETVGLVAFLFCRGSREGGRDMLSVIEVARPK